MQRRLGLFLQRPLSPVETDTLRVAVAGIDSLTLDALDLSRDLGIDPADTSQEALHRLLRHAEGCCVSHDAVVAFYGWLHPVSPTGHVNRSHHCHALAPVPVPERWRPGWALNLPHPGEDWEALCCWLLFRARTSNRRQVTPVRAVAAPGDRAGQDRLGGVAAMR